MSQSNHRPITLRSRSEFIAHAARFFGIALGLLVFFLGVGTLGYPAIVGLGWLDSLLNAAMILTGMGPVDRMETGAATFFASAYSIVGGAVYPALTALVLYPFVHRMLNILHLRALNTPTDDQD